MRKRPEPEETPTTGLMGEHITPVGFTFPEGMSTEGWMAAAVYTRNCEQGWPWYLADLLTWADSHGFSLQAEQELSKMFAPALLTDKRFMGKRFPLAERREGLSFSHHRAVAYDLSKEEADDLLAQAIASKWTRDELARHVKRLKDSKLPRKDNGNSDGIDDDIGGDVRALGGSVLSRGENEEIQGRNGGPEKSGMGASGERRIPFGGSPEPQDLSELYQSAVDLAVGFVSLLNNPSATTDRIYMKALLVRDILQGVIDALERTGVQVL